MREILKRIPPKSALAAFSLGLAAVLFLLHVPFDSILEMQVPVNFEVPLLARDRMLQGVDPYVPHEPLPYKYSPFAAIPYMLLPKDHGSAWIAFKLLCVASLAAVLAAGFRPVTRRRVALAALGALLAWKGFSSTLFYGQLEFVILALAVLATALLGRSFFWAGLVVGVLPWLKIPLGFLFVPFAAEAAWRAIEERSLKKPLALALGIGSAAALCGAILPFAVFGYDATVRHTLSWIELVRTQPRELYEEPLNQSLWMALERWFGPAGSSLPAKLAAVGAVGAATLALARSRARRWARGNELAWITPWLLLNHLINPLAWMWGSLYVLGIPLALESARSEGNRGLRRALWAIVAVSWCLQQRPFHALLGFRNWEDVFPYANMTVFWLALLGLVLVQVSSGRKKPAAA